MKQSYSVQCQNCGAEFTPAFSLTTHRNKIGCRCPVCNYYNTISETPVDQPTLHSQDELENQLSTFMHKVRMDGLSADTIVHALRRELEFAAELAHPGRRLYVQLIDLGSQDFEGYDHPLPDQREILQRRSISQ